MPLLGGIVTLPTDCPSRETSMLRLALTFDTTQDAEAQNLHLTAEPPEAGRPAYHLADSFLKTIPSLPDALSLAIIFFLSVVPMAVLAATILPPFVLASE